MRCTSVFLGAVAAVLVAAHPGHDVAKEQAARSEFLQHSKKDLSHCAAKIKERGLEARNHQRRQDLAGHLMKKRGLSIHERKETPAQPFPPLSKEHD